MNPKYSRHEGSGKSSQKIEVFDILTNEKQIYNSFSAAALALQIPKSAISMSFLNNQKKTPQIVWVNFYICHMVLNKSIPYHNIQK